MPLGKKAYFNIVGSPGKIPALDGLRAIAVLLVLLRHGVLVFENEISQGLFTQPLISFALNGWLGVDLFFVLSGFLITHHLLEQRRRSTFSFSSYALKRVLRTFPLYYVVLLVAFSGIVPYSEVDEPLSWSAASKYILFLQDYLGSSILVPLWSLAVEEKFYLFAPILVLGLMSLPRRVVPAAIVLLALSSASMRYVAVGSLSFGDYSDFFWSVRSPFHQCLDGVFWGMLMAWFVSGEKVLKNIAGSYVFYISLAGILVILFMVPFVEFSLWNIIAPLIFVVSGLFALMVWAATVDDKLSLGLWGGRCLRVIAKLSYALYLTHYLFIPLALKCAEYGEGSISLFLFWLVYLGAAFLAAVFLHLLVEKPFLLMKEKVV